MKIGGMEIHLRYMLRHLADSKRYENIILAEISCGLITITDTENHTSYTLIGFENFTEHLRNLRAEVLFFNDGHWLEYFYELRKIFPRSVFIMRSGGNEFMKAPYHDMTLPLSERQNLWSRAINHNIDFIIANSVYTWQRMIRIGISSAKIFIVRGGVDLSSVAINTSDKNLRGEFDKKFGTSGKYIFCIAARHVKFKGIMEILYIFSGFESSGKWFLLIAGDGKESQSLREYCAEHLPHGSFVFLGAVEHEELMKYISLSDCLISSSRDTFLPSGNDFYLHTETMGRTIIEAACHHVPVIATNAGAVHEWFDEIDGLGVFLPNDSRGQKEIIRRAFEDKLTFSADKDLSVYSWHNIVDVFYSELFRKKRRFVHTVLCTDLDDTIIFPFMNFEENSALLGKIISLASDKCEIVLNSAGDFHDITSRYPVIADNLSRLIIISNAGGVIINHGQRDILWQEYYHMQNGISSQEIAQAEEKISKAGLVLVRKKIICKLYVNFKVKGTEDQIRRAVSQLNSAVKNPSRLAVSNLGNIKLISRIINKGSALAYLKNAELLCERTIGAGNGVLDELFFTYCDKIFIMNSSKQIPDTISIKNFREAENFIDRLCGEILQET